MVMSITSAFIRDTGVQKDGRTYVTEIQVDDTLGQLQFLYLANPGTDFTSVMNARTAQINAVAQGAILGG